MQNNGKKVWMRRTLFSCERKGKEMPPPPPLPCLQTHFLLLLIHGGKKAAAEDVLSPQDVGYACVRTYVRTNMKYYTTAAAAMCMIQAPMQRNLMVTKAIARGGQTAVSGGLGATSTALPISKSCYIPLLLVYISCMRGIMGLTCWDGQHTRR